MKTEYDVIVVGGGAAGFFTALNIKQYMPNTEVLILERTKEEGEGNTWEETIQSQGPSSL